MAGEYKNTSEVALSDQTTNVEASLKAYKVEYKKTKLVNKFSTQFIVDAFGLIVCIMYASDFSQVRDKLLREHSGWRIVYVTPEDSILDYKDEILWGLMRGGYIRYLRTAYSSNFSWVLNRQELARKIINKRLEIWKDKAKYKFFIEENKDALKMGSDLVLSIDASFYDYLPEED